MPRPARRPRTSGDAGGHDSGEALIARAGVLALDSGDWGALAQAFGSAEDIPRLLEALERVTDDERREIWLGLWATLCREGEVWTASYAALPHLVAFAAGQGIATRTQALHLVGAIEVGRRTAGAPALPGPLADAYDSAMALVPHLVADLLDEPWPPDATQVLAAVLAIAKGHVAFGAAALRLEPAVTCPLCGGMHAADGWTLDAGA